MTKVLTDLNEDYRRARELVKEVKSLEQLPQSIEDIINLERLAYLITLADELDIGGRVSFEELNTIIKQTIITEDITPLIHALKEVTGNDRNTTVRRGLESIELVINLDIRDIRRILEEFLSEGLSQRLLTEIIDRTMQYLLLLGHKIESFINKYRYHYGDKVARNEVERLLLFPNFTLKVELIGDGITKLNTKSRIKASIKPLITLLSEELYCGNWRIFFREMIENAIDSIKLRAIETCKENPELCEIEEDEYGFKYLRINGWKPYIKIVIECADDTCSACSFVIEDNGRGMDRIEIEDYLLNIGYSYYTHYLAKEKEEMYRSLMPLSMYGIGFLTAFMLYNRNVEPWHGEIIIETVKRYENKSRRIIVRILDPDQPYMIREEESGREDQGTRIIVKVKDERVMSEISEIINSFKECEEMLKEKIFELILAWDVCTDVPPPVPQSVYLTPVLLHTTPWIRVQLREKEQLVQLPVKLVVELRIGNRTVRVYDKPLKIEENSLLSRFYGKLELLDRELIDEYGVVIRAYKAREKVENRCLLDTVLDLNARGALILGPDSLVSFTILKSSVSLPRVVFVLTLNPSQVALDLQKAVILDLNLPEKDVEDFLRRINRFYVKVVNRLIDSEWKVLKELVMKEGIAIVGEPLTVDPSLAERIRRRYIEYSDIEEFIMKYMGFKSLIDKKPKYLAHHLTFTMLLKRYNVCVEDYDCLKIETDHTELLKLVSAITQVIREIHCYSIPVYIEIGEFTTDVIVRSDAIAGERCVDIDGMTWCFKYSFGNLFDIVKQCKVKCLCYCWRRRHSCYCCYCVINNEMEHVVNTNADRFFKDLASTLMNMEKVKWLDIVGRWIVISA